MQVKFTGITLDVKTGKDQTKRILDDVSGHFGPAESVAVMGPSGSGKTTLLLCVSGAASPTSGSVEVNGAPFDAGTNAVARRAAELTAMGSLVSVAGGGDTVAALRRADAIDGFSYVSTAGGAFLEWLEGSELPGVAALSN